LVRVLLVDDDESLRALLRATLDVFDVEIDEAENAPAAQAALRKRLPDAIVLDVMMPGGIDGVELTHILKNDPETAQIPIVLLTGSVGRPQHSAADAVLTKPFSPLELLGVVERLVGGMYGVPFRASKGGVGDEEQLLLYARDLRHLLALERGQRTALEAAYRDTVVALASALEQKDTGTRAHSQRVQRYALDLASVLSPSMLDRPGPEYGFLLHDVGKIGIPDEVLRKPGPLTAGERRLMETHTIVGEQMLAGVSFLRGDAISVVRSHHERWDGSGYPDQMGGEEIPLGARIFAVADTLDAMTSNRPYRAALPWSQAAREIEAQSGKQFDPVVVETFRERESSLREIQRSLTAA
jgi:response regulator RpfG family c-di-GMP phosphodiesterase